MNDEEIILETKDWAGEKHKENYGEITAKGNIYYLVETMLREAIKLAREDERKKVDNVDYKILEIEYSNCEDGHGNYCLYVMEKDIEKIREILRNESDFLVASMYPVLDKLKKLGFDVKELRPYNTFWK